MNAQQQQQQQQQIASLSFASNNNGHGSPGITAAALERLEQPWGRGYDVLVINLFCALPATRRAETSFSRRIGLPRGHDLKNPPTAFGRITLQRRKLVALLKSPRKLHPFIPTDLGTSFVFSGGIFGVRPGTKAVQDG